jgi:hypothetical protein
MLEQVVPGSNSKESELARDGRSKESVPGNAHLHRRSAEQMAAMTAGTVNSRKCVELAFNIHRLVLCPRTQKRAPSRICTRRTKEIPSMICTTGGSARLECKKRVRTLRGVFGRKVE